jgi:hypothetical protein
LYSPRKQTSWRPWGGFHTEADIAVERERISSELEALAAKAEFPVECKPLVTVATADEAGKVAAGDQDLTIIYAASAGLDVLEALTVPERWTLVFVRHRSGPVYLWYEIAHNRYLRKTVDDYGQPGVDYRDVVVDDTDEVLWRLRALCGLKNALNKKIVAVGGAGGWGAGGREAPNLARQIWKMDIQAVEYPELGKLIRAAREDRALARRCAEEADRYLKAEGVSLETDRQFVRNAFLLDSVFRRLLASSGADAFTINQCMGTIMPMAETTACLPLSLLNDTGYNAYCESDFVVIPSGVLLHYISGRPVFLNDPTYPHDGVVTLAHCTAPRKMDGLAPEPARILTHFESDYGAAPKVEMKLGQTLTVIDPDFSGRRWLGFEAEIIDNPFLDICRSQIDVQIHGDGDRVTAETKGFHWMACYGHYLKEVGYALGKVGIEWTQLSKA